MTDLSIPDIELENNNSQRLPCVLLLDASGSMAGTPVNELNQGLRALEQDLKTDAIAKQRVQLLVIKFSGDDDVEVLADWTDAMNFDAPNLVANGRTPLGEAVRLGLAKIEEQKARYRAHAIPYNRPWIFLITDGSPTDAGWEQAAVESRSAEQADKVVFFSVGVGTDADLGKLSQFSSRQPVRLEGLKFRELFLWLSASARSASKAAQGTQVQLASPSEWLQVPT